MSLIFPRMVGCFRSPVSRAFDEMFNEMAQMERAFYPMTRYAVRPMENGSEIVNDSQKFQLCLDVAQFKPEEIKVSLEGRTLTIEGNQENKDENGFFKRSFSRRWLLPDDVNISDIKSSLTDTGRLSIEAPKKSPEVTQIPIQNVATASSPEKKTT